ncbi:hypothetical protein NEHOM01_0640 [Nematocida homosporus]|uniref:uncharacterized protein n=1 Tax=Nematocida homosporus TaxID=1912981 RepID=UPI00221EA97A|nr:uncharacterized protein NEHOM01_0640 [Nematocida homosporus]KAI5185135.1 hypothetical protein NEHOM01_0640 [Nematocida homosporus]
MTPNPSTIQRTVQLAYNQLASSTLSQVFNKIEQVYQNSPDRARSALLTVISTPNAQTNLLVLSSFLSLVHSLLDKQIIKSLLKPLIDPKRSMSPDTVTLLCYLNTYGVIDTSYINRALTQLVEQHELLQILRILQMTSTTLDKEVLSLLKTKLAETTANSLSENESQTTQSSTPSYLPTFLLWALNALTKNQNPFREVLKEEIATMKESIKEIVDKTTAQPIEVQTEAVDQEEVAAAKFGMNTTLKKRVFSIITTSKDFPEAQGLLYKEALKVKQFAEVFNLLLFLCLKEQKYNRYYADLATSLIKTARPNHQSSFNKHLYTAIEKQLAHLETLPIKEIYNLASFIAAIYSEGLITLKCLNHLTYRTKEPIVLLKVLFKTLLANFRHNLIKKPKTMKESETIRTIFNNRLIDGLFLHPNDQSDLTRLYEAIYRRK